MLEAELNEAEVSRAATGFHEAGHAVAAVMRGGSSLTSVSLDEHLHGAGMTWSRALVFDQPFLIWAGPWAEARHAWGDRPLDDEDEDGCILDDYVAGVFMSQPDDAEQYRLALRALSDLGVPDGLTAATERVWAREMEDVWTAVEAVAAALLRGKVIDDAAVRTAVTGALADSLKAPMSANSPEMGAARRQREC
jgi:hypothetical protein